MQQLRIPDAATVYGNDPHLLSGGMKQRIVIAMALAADPDSSSRTNPQPRSM